MGIDAWILLAALTLGPAFAALICACITGAFRVPVEPMNETQQPKPSERASLQSGTYSDLR